MRTRDTKMMCVEFKRRSEQFVYPVSLLTTNVVQLKMDRNLENDDVNNRLKSDLLSKNFCNAGFAY